MRSVPFIIFRLIALTVPSLTPAALYAATLPPPGIYAPASHLPSTVMGADALETLDVLQDKQDEIRQRASSATSDAQLLELDAESRRVAEDVDRLISTSLQPDRAKTQAQIDVLGATATPESNAETPAIARQRSSLAEQQAQFDAELRQAGIIKENLANVSAQIVRLLHDHLKDELALRSGSILSAPFWGPVLR